MPNAWVHVHHNFWTVFIFTWSTMNICDKHLWRTICDKHMWQTYVTNICDKHMWQTFVMNKWIKDLRNGKYIYRSVHRQSRDSLCNNDVSCVWMWMNINIYWHCMTVGMQLHHICDGQTHSDWLCWVAGSVVTQLADIISSYDQMRTKK